MMTDRASTVSHLIARLIGIINLALWGVMSYPAYFHALAGGMLGHAIGVWFLLSSFLLPLYVTLETWWMRQKSQQRALRIDAVFAAAWFLVFCGAVLYGVRRYGIGIP
jgi:hypothetical protein